MLGLAQGHGGWSGMRGPSRDMRAGQECGGWSRDVGAHALIAARNVGKLDPRPGTMTNR